MDANSERKIIKTLQANQIAKEFTELYYKCLNKRREVISKMYLDNSSLIWQGNLILGKDNIQKFWLNFLSSEHTPYTLDAQPIIGSEVDDRELTRVDVKIAGQIKRNLMSGCSIKMFNQTLLIMAVDNKWKIVNDCFCEEIV